VLDVPGAAVRSPITEVSALNWVLPDTSVLVIPGPTVTLFELRNARWSAPPFASHDPDVADHVNRGIASAGKAVTPLCATHPLLQLAVTLCPTVNVPALETYMNASPLPAEIVTVVPLPNEYTSAPNLTVQGVDVKQPAPIASVVALLRATAKSPNWLAMDAAGGPCSSVQEFDAVQPYTFMPALASSR
jgi:hypothetical protein